MPIYAFQCAQCGHAFDRLQKLSDADPTVCPECGAVAISRQLTAPQFRLAGGGWYETDFKGDGDRKRNIAGDSKADSSGESKPAEGVSKSDTAAAPGTDAKPASKSDTAAAPAKPAKPVENKPASTPKPDAS